MSMMFGLIGASYVAASRMMPAFAANGIAPKALFDSDESRFKYWVDADLDLLTPDLEQLLDSDIDAVYISSRNDEHAAQAIAAAEAGKHVLLEKPMALTLADARAIVEAAEKNGVQLAVNHHLPGSPLHSTARSLVEQGRIGTLYSARINHAVLLPESLRGWRLASVPGGGVVFDITVHDASVLNPLFAGDPVRVSALGVSQAAWNTARSRDSVMTIIEYAPGAEGVAGLAQTHDAFTVPYPGTSMEIHGESGAIVIGDAMTQDTAGTVTLITAAGIEPIDVDTTTDLYQINVEAFVRAVRGQGKPTASGTDGLSALQVALAAEHSLSSGCVVEIASLS
jgi:1,5-anhydro-D-fructose reductase (1,5-anhydro-D-mannitol-forming)